MTSNVNLHSESVCKFSVEWLIDLTQSNYKKLQNCCPIEVYIWSHNFKTISWNKPIVVVVIAESSGIYIIWIKQLSLEQNLQESPLFIRARFFWDM